MAYKSILTVATNTTGLAPVLQAASRIALREDSHLEVLVVGVDVLQPAFYGYADSIGLMQDTLDQARAAAEATEAAAKGLLGAESPALRWSVEAATALAGNLRDLVAHHARFSDLVVLPQPYGPHSPQEAVAVLEAALFEGQAAVLVLPGGRPVPDAFGTRILVAWNQGREALAAIRRAMPLLVAARQVGIVVIDPPVHGPERSDPGGRLCQMLARHGVRAEVAVLARTEPRTSDVLARHIREQGADLLVMGAYGHSRLRESILGGTTRNMLHHAEVPVLLAH
ncbi:MAG: universal stress protein [Pseudomonadota bacterium]